MTGKSDKMALLIYCTREEGEQIKRAAKSERRTISGYAMNAIMSRLALQQRIEMRKQKELAASQEYIPVQK